MTRFRLWSAPPLLRSTDNYIPAANTLRFLAGKKRVLIVGDAGGRDYRYLTQHGKEVYCVDLANQAFIPDLIVQSIEDKTPFEDEFFDGVVMNEVLEHMFRDVDALEEVHRILKADGVLVVTVPYMSNVQDVAEYHVRVHSPRTIRRLLERCGFRIRVHFCRGIFSRFIELSLVFRAAIYLTIKLVEILLRRTPEDATRVVNGVFDRLERTLGRSRLARAQKFSAGYGGILCAEKGDRKDFLAVQRQQFQDTRLF